MKNFKHFQRLQCGRGRGPDGRYGERAAVIAGGTDILGKMKDSILPTYPRR
jgi:hypothetical protein